MIEKIFEDAGFRINPEILSDKATHIFNGVRVKVFKSTYSAGSNTISGEILEGEHKGKWTTVYLDRAEEIK